HRQRGVRIPRLRPARPPRRTYARRLLRRRWLRREGGTKETGPDPRPGFGPRELLGGHLPQGRPGRARPTPCFLVLVRDRPMGSDRQPAAEIRALSRTLQAVCDTPLRGRQRVGSGRCVPGIPCPVPTRAPALPI